jgi:hypothetical protein
MQLPVQKIVLLAKRLDMQELNRLADITQFVEIVGRLVHQLQAERGASSIFLATKGSDFGGTRLQLITESKAVEDELRAIIASQVEGASFSKAKLLYLMAWVLIGLGELPALRARVGKHELATDECIVAYSRLIASLMSLIFEAADSAVDPRTSSLLVALFNLVQGKEFAGQERAVGAWSFSGGACNAASRNRMLYLIDAQERHFRIFTEFGGGPLLEKWQAILDAPYLAPLERLRRMLCRDNGELDTNLSATWFEICSERLSAIWSLQCAVVRSLQAQCAALISEAESELRDSEGLLKTLSANPPAQAALASRIFDSAIPVEEVLRFEFRAGSPASQGQSIMDVFHAQSQRLSSMETELAAARRALDERKTIERAKGILMARFHLSEDDAYKRMRTASMEQNKRLVDVAEAILMLVALS